MPTVGELVRWGAAELRGSDSGRLDAELLLAETLGVDRASVFRDGRCAAPVEAAARYRDLIAARAAGRPLAQILGHREFWSLTLDVDEHCLVPRPETELLVELALAALPDDAPAVIADLGTGSGAIALAIALERPSATVLAIDASAGALRVAAINIERHAKGRVLAVRADWLGSFAAAVFDIIVSNPPYVADDDPLLARSELRFEPRCALAAGPDGLRDLTALAGQCARALRPGGRVFLEHGATQGGDVRALLAAAGFAEVATVRDLAGLERVSRGTRP